MAMKSLGSQKGDSPRTPTLRQFIKAGNEVVTNNYVNMIFLPGDYHQITLCVSTGWRVLIGETNPLYGELLRLFEDLEELQTCLLIQVKDPENMIWELFDKDDTITEWKRNEWGFKSEKISPKKPAGKKKTGTDGQVG